MTDNTVTKQPTGFCSAEHLWFWFVSSRQLRNGLYQDNKSYSFRPCELVDVETLLTQMYLSGRLNSAELEVMKKYGELRRCPNQCIWEENKDASLWLSAMRTIEISARNKGWIY